MSASVNKSQQLRVLIALTLSGAIAMPAFAAEQAAKLPPRTIRDLEKREVKVNPDPPSDVKTQQAIEQYRRFLEMESNNEKLRAEAMRRLGDLQVEDDERAHGRRCGLAVSASMRPCSCTKDC